MDLKKIIYYYYTMAEHPSQLQIVPPENTDVIVGENFVIMAEDLMFPIDKIRGIVKRMVDEVNSGQTETIPKTESGYIRIQVDQHEFQISSAEWNKLLTAFNIM
jgi:hypothetical protein